MSTLPVLSPLPPVTQSQANQQSYDQQNLSALNDALNQYQTAAQNGIPGAAQLAANAQAALNAYGSSAQTQNAASGTPTPTPSNSQSTGTASNPAQGGILERSIVLILGVILFGAGLLSFKTSQTVITTATNTAKKAGEIAAL